MTVSPARWPLRWQLLGAILVLLALLGAIVGTVSVLALRSFLVDRLDAQLVAATTRSQQAVGMDFAPQDEVPERQPFGCDSVDAPDAPTDPEGEPPGFVALPGQSEGTLGALVCADSVISAERLDASGEPRVLTAAQQELLRELEADTDPVTVDLGGGLGEYRLVAVTMREGGVLVIGLPLDDVTATELRLLAVIVSVTVLGLLVAAAAGLLIVRLALRPLERVAATATDVTALSLDRGEVALAARVPERDTDPSTEVGRVGAALNRMLGHVGAALSARHRSEERLRRFVADASHELRTPLASIRGYAELTRRGGYELPEDAAYALGRVESEATRMTGLVEDLLLLARLDADQELVRAEVDLVPLVADAVHDAHAAGQQHRWHLALEEDALPIIADRLRLQQVIANLLANARVHTPEGTDVTVSLAREGGEAVLRVADTGPGIPEELRPDLFQRFVRGDSSRSREAGSTGLGLAIVEAVVLAHGGTVSVTANDSASDSPGAVFTLRLPLAP